MKENKNGGVAILSIASILFALLYSTPRLIHHYNAWQANREEQRRMERIQELTEQGQQYLAEERWVEAKAHFSKARDIADSHIPASIGLAESLLHLEGTEAALDSLNACSHTDCDKERESLHRRAWENLLARSICAENIEEAWGHAEALFSPSCVVEKIIRQNLAATTQERSGLNDALIKLLKSGTEETESAAMESAAHAAGIPAPELAETVSNLAMLSALNRAGQMTKRGQRMGADLVHDPAFLANAACTLTDKLWEEDSRGFSRMVLSPNLPFPDYESGGNSVGDLMSDINRQRNRQEYTEQMRRLYELGTALGMLEEVNKWCENGCRENKIPGPQADVLKIAKRLW